MSDSQTITPRCRIKTISFPILSRVSNDTDKKMREHIKGRRQMSLEDVREGLISKLYFGEYPIDNILLNALHYLGVNVDD